MGYIYKITNTIDGRVYVGATLRSPQRRFAEHIRDAARFPDRPLYKALNSYGADSFTCEVIEECHDQNIEERELHWIDKLNTFSNGYNATYGGSGKRMVETDRIIELWESGKTIKEIHEMTGYDGDSIRKTLDYISSNEFKERADISKSKPVEMLDKDTEEVIRVFSGIWEANKYLSKKSGGHICQACAGRRRTAYGYKWKYAT